MDTVARVVVEARRLSQTEAWWIVCFHAAHFSPFFCSHAVNTAASQACFWLCNIMHCVSCRGALPVQTLVVKKLLSRRPEEQCLWGCRCVENQFEKLLASNERWPVYQSKGVWVVFVRWPPKCWSKRWWKSWSSWKCDAPTVQHEVTFSQSWARRLALATYSE